MCYNIIHQKFAPSRCQPCCNLFSSNSCLKKFILFIFHHSQSVTRGCCKQQMPAYSLCHICHLSSSPGLCRYLQDTTGHLQRAPILNHYPPPPLKLKCKTADSPMRFLDIICCPPPPLTAAPLKRHSEVWQQVGDFWQVALISWLGKKSAWQWRTCVRFGTSLNLSDPLIWDAPTEKPSFG